MTDASKVAIPISDDIMADRLGLTLREFRRYRGQGLVLVSVSVHDEAKLQITCQLGNRIWEGIVEAGAITFEEVRFMRGARSRRAPS